MEIHVFRCGFIICRVLGLKAEGMSARLVNFLCTGRIMIGAGLDMVCWGTSNTLLASLMIGVVSVVRPFLVGSGYARL